MQFYFMYLVMGMMLAATLWKILEVQIEVMIGNEFPEEAHGIARAIVLIYMVLMWPIVLFDYLIRRKP